MVILIVKFVTGLVFLVAGAEVLVRGGSSIAHRIGVSSLVVGLTVVAFGTSAPEMLVSVQSVFHARDGVALGNVVGSNIFNALFILGIAAVVSPLSISAKSLKRDIPVLVLTSLIVVFLAWDGSFERYEGVAMLAAFFAYLFLIFRKSHGQPEDKQVTKPFPGLILAIALVIGGLAALIFGAGVLVNASVDLARRLQISEAIIGLTIVAAGTSLPELATSVVASLRGERDLAIGNVVGSNIFNILAIIGVSSIIRPLQVGDISRADFGVMLGSVFLLLPLLGSGLRLSRWEGLVLIAFYGAYVAYLWPAF